MSSDLPLPETKVLAIASHVVYGYVGNTMATFVMQSLGCEVAAMNTVHFSNHTGYRQFEGTRASSGEIRDLYKGLQQSYLTDFDVLLSGYAPSAEVVEAIGYIARDLRQKATMKPGSFFWVLDPVMGDQGRLYVKEDVIPAYKSLLADADLILPNQFEAETLSGVTISSLSSLATAISTLHAVYKLPHIIVTSISLPQTSDSENSTLTVVGSSATSTNQPRLFKVTVPALPVFFSGTGDMFAALTVARLREACAAADLLSTKAWMSPDDVKATELPLAKAVEKVLGSMAGVLEKTMGARNKEIEGLKGDVGRSVGGVEGDASRSSAVGVDAVEGSNGMSKRGYLMETKAAEIRLVRNMRLLVKPERTFTAEPLEV